MMAPDEMQMVQVMPLRQDMTDTHFAQVFFVIGHIAIKMLSYVEMLEAELKQALTNSFNRKKQEDEQGKKEDDLAQITGGKEAEVEQYTARLAELVENDLI